jgi:hypothetical protein
VINPVASAKIDTVTIRTDILTDVVNDNSVSDIGANRGLYIQSEDQLLELRILGSIRALFNYSSTETEDRQSVDPYGTPTGPQSHLPNFFATLQQTRIGFEVTRKTQSLGDIFMRLEADFNQSNNTLRIRHAYGTAGRFLVGQTWSLMNNAGYEPRLVSRDGSPGVITIRTPQIRYSQRFKDNTSWSVGLEYLPPDVSMQDTMNVNALQAIPNLTARYTYSRDRLTFRLAGTSSLLVDKGQEIKTGYRTAWGISMAINLQTGPGKLFSSFTTGRSIANYLNVFHGHGLDITFDEENKKYISVFTTAGYLAYEQPLPRNLRASVSAGFATLGNRDSRLPDDYKVGYNVLINVFWEPIPGMALGIEYGLASRTDLNDQEGFVNRISMLAYYDF